MIEQPNVKFSKLERQVLDIDVRMRLGMISEEAAADEMRALGFFIPRPLPDMNEIWARWRNIFENSASGPALAAVETEFAALVTKQITKSSDPAKAQADFD